MVAGLLQPGPLFLYRMVAGQPETMETIDLRTGNATPVARSTWGRVKAIYR